MTEEKSYKLSDSTISQIVQLIQLGILTGTDISDQMRTLRLSVDEDTCTVVPCQQYMDQFNENLEKMRSAFNESGE